MADTWPDQDEQDMLRVLANYKPRCKVFRTWLGCWKGRKCPFLHTKEPPTPFVELGPWVDVRTDDAGNQKIAPRLSMTECIKKAFSEQGTVVCIRQAGRQAGRHAPCSSEIGIGLLRCMGQV